ncbi:MAG: MFS transporter [Candidatus Marinimicrobia bacterium]|nr:MFS transporter [Candidatus Neomarinimicrobiota bacterium]
MELNKQISKQNYYSFLWHAVFLALATNFMDVDTIIPAMIVDAGGSALQLGILTAIMLGGGRFAQLFFAPFLNNQSSKKGYLLGGINARILALGGMALLFYFSPNINDGFIILSIFTLISLFSFSGAFANINYVDILGKSVLQEKRKSFFSIKQVISSIVVFLSAFLARRVLISYEYPVNYATLFFFSAALLGIASLGFWKIKEITASNFKINGLVKYINIIIKEIHTNKKLRYYLFLINTQGISIVLMPFLILYAKRIFSAGSQDIGDFLILKVIGGVLTGSILFYYSRKIKYQLMLYTTSIIAMLIPLFILTLSGSVLFPYIFLAGGIVFTIHRIAISGVLLEITSNNNRALYTGLTGAGGILPVIFPFLGGWIITEFGFNLFFILFIAVILMSFYFIYKIDCKK